MKFALINADAESLTLLRTLVAGGHELMLVADPGDQKSALHVLAPEARFVEGWEDALACGADAVVVGRSGEEAARLDRLRLLIQERVPTIFVHPQSASALAYYELDMHRQATNSPLVPYDVTRHHPALARLSELGTIEEAIVERRAARRSRWEMLDLFVRDVGAIRRCTGACERVSAVGSLPTDAGDGRLGVQMTTDAATIVRWSIGSSGGVDDARWRFTASDASAVIDAPADGRWTLQLTRDGRTETTHYEANAALQSAADAVLAAIAEPQEKLAPQSLWREALADLELVEAVERSVRKGRTVELFHEEASEQGTFKGVMAAGGCLLLMLAIGLAITATIFGRFRLVIANAWPYALLSVLSIFLLLQLFRFVFPPVADPNRND